MRLSEISAAIGMKFKLTYNDLPENISIGALIAIDEIKEDDKSFIVKAFGIGHNTDNAQVVLCKADDIAAEYLHDLLRAEFEDSFRCLFSVEDITKPSIEVQSYTFKSVTHYKTPIYIQISEKLLETKSPDKLNKEFIWDQLGQPAIFCLNYKNKKKQAADVRFLSERNLLLAHNTPRGIIADSERSIKDRDALPIDIYIAPSIQFVAESDAPQVNGTFSDDLDRISNPATYFARWEAYNTLSKRILDKESEEFGELGYLSYTTKTDLNGTSFIFQVNEELDLSCLGKELGVRENFDESDVEITGNRKPRQVAVGEIKRIEGKCITTYLASTDFIDPIPSDGNLTLYTAGDRFIIARREAARERMVKHESPIKYIVALIEAGTTKYDWSNHKAITEELKKNFDKALDLNPEQIEAIQAAINTPDIALIQGPPGTGKTTVIKAICERFREIFEAEERQRQNLNSDYMLRSPKILISSFQNEAVDNAISAPLAGDIPAFRKTAKRASSSTYEQYQRALDKWYSGVKSSISDTIGTSTSIQFVAERNALNDEYLSYKNSGEDLELATILIKRYLSLPDVHYPQQLFETATSLIRAIGQADESEDVTDPIVQRLNSQRTDEEAFADDGKINAKRLLAQLRIRSDIELDSADITSIEDVCGEAFTEHAFEKYVGVIQRMQKRFCRQPLIVNESRKTDVNECLIELNECYVNQYLHTLSDIDGKKSLILSEFLSRLEQEYEAIVRKYSMTTAATCQTSLDLRAITPQVFDLVVIDEAARANPLDLFIPMSMGKKVVLVGDHKQLPHMLEPDVLKMILDDPKFKDLPEIEKSLFERLFGMFSEGEPKRAVLLTHQFRMHPDICRFVSECFYDGLLKTSDSVTAEMRSSPLQINNGQALTFVNVPISRGPETPGVSKSRRAEVSAVCSDVKSILEADTIPTNRVGVITFYSAQANQIRKSLELLLDDEEAQRVEVGTVDAFQGKEFAYVLLSCVRSNVPKGKDEKPQVGFLDKPNRLCVAFSRAIKQLAVYGDAATLTQIPCFAKLFNLCSVDKGGCYREY